MHCAWSSIVFIFVLHACFHPLNKKNVAYESMHYYCSLTLYTLKFYSGPCITKTQFNRLVGNIPISIHGWHKMGYQTFLLCLRQINIGYILWNLKNEVSENQLLKHKWIYFKRKNENNPFIFRFE